MSRLGGQSRLSGNIHIGASNRAQSEGTLMKESEQMMAAIMVLGPFTGAPLAISILSLLGGELLAAAIFAVVATIPFLVSVVLFVRLRRLLLKSDE